MMTFSLAKYLSKRGIETNALHPSTFMNMDVGLEAGFDSRSSVETSRSELMQLISEDAGTVQYFSVFQEARIGPRVYDVEATARLTKGNSALASKRAEEVN